MKARALFIAFTALALSWMAFRDAAVQVLMSTDPLSAPGMLEGQPRLALAIAEREQGGTPDASHADPRGLAKPAKAVLRGSPLEPAAIRSLALSAGDVAAVRQGLLTAQRVSRRSKATQYLLLRLAAQQGEIGPALTHLDNILTVWPHDGPSLAEAAVPLLDDPDGVDGLARYTNRPWFPDFSLRAIGLADDPRDVAAVLAQGGMTDAASRDRIMPKLLQRLIEIHEYDAARDFAIRFGGIDPATLADFRVTQDTTAPRLGLLGWRLAATGGARTSLTDDGAVQIDLAPGFAAVPLERVTLLAPGEYALDQRLRGDGAADMLRWEWEVICPGVAAGPIWRQIVPVATTHVRYRSRAVVPPGCRAQRWRLKALLNDTQSSVGLRIAGLTLASMGPSVAAH